MRLWGVVLGLAMLAGPAGGQEARLREALASVPAAALVFERAEMVAFVDIAAVLEIGGTPFDVDAIRRVGAGSTLRMIDALRMAGPNFAPDTGVDIDTVAAVAGYGAPPARVALWLFTEDGGAEALYAGLGTAGFSEIGDGVLANGEPGRMDMGARDQFDPWRGGLGLTSIVTLAGEVLVQADRLEDLPNAASGSVLDTPAVATALGGLEAVAGETIVQALLFSPAAGLSQGDAGGLMPYALGFAADTGGAAPGLAVSLAYPDCDSAKTAAKRMQEAWPEQAARLAVPTTTTVATEAGAVGCAALFTATQDAGGAVLNHPFTAFLEGLYRGELVLVRIGG